MAQSLIKGTLVLTAASLVTRMIGLIYRIYLVRLAGNEVIGLFQMIFPLYFTMIVIASAGLPIAVSKMVADRAAIGREDSIRRVMRMSTLLSVTMGSFATLLLFASARMISYKILGDSRTFLALMVIAPSLPLISLSSTLKGFFQGVSFMTPVAISQVVEQLTHVFATVALIAAYRAGDHAAITAVLATGSLLGDLAGVVVITGAYRIHTLVRWRSARKSRSSRNGNEKFRTLLAELTALAAPITLGRIVVSLNSTINSALVPNLLKAGGASVNEATIMFGELTGMAMNLLTIPTVFTTSMAVNLVPNVASSKARLGLAQVQARTVQALKFTYIIGIFFAASFAALGVTMCRLFFNSGNAGVMLVILAPGGLALYHQHILSGVLQGLNKTHIPMICSLISTAFSTCAIYLATKVFALGIRGTAAAMSLSMILGALLNFAAVAYNVKINNMSSFYLKVTGSGVLAATAGWFCNRAILSAGTYTGISIAASLAVTLILYIASLFTTKAISAGSIIRISNRHRKR